MFGFSSQNQATLSGLGAILLWGLLALLTSLCGNIPPFLLTSLTFCVAFLAGSVAFVRAGADFTIFRQSPSVWLNGILGLFGYHALYFMALQNAPVVEANLINYLWPVLIVLFSSLMPGERLRWFHALGVLLGFLGVLQLLLGDGSFRFDPRYAGGYALALACAVIWALYSVISRKHQGVPTLLIGAYCGVTALLSFLCHLAFEKPATLSPTDWLLVALMGLGPIGLAFFAWDHGVKHGNIKLLGALSYLAPLLSSALLILFGRAPFRMGILIACALIICGSAVASMRVQNSPPRSRLHSAP